MKTPLILLLTLALLPIRGQDPNSLEFQEAFAWGDRTRALDMLVPNTDEFYFYTALHHQLSGDRAGVERTLRDWRQFLGNRSLPPQYREIDRRQKLLDFEREPGMAWDMIRRDLGLLFNHRRRDEVRLSTAPPWSIRAPTTWMRSAARPTVAAGSPPTPPGGWRCSTPTA